LYSLTRHNKTSPSSQSVPPPHHSSPPFPPNSAPTPHYNTKPGSTINSPDSAYPLRRIVPPPQPAFAVADSPPH
jgi:hypothetical protein